MSKNCDCQPQLSDPNVFLTLNCHGIACTGYGHHKRWRIHAAYKNQSVDRIWHDHWIWTYLAAVLPSFAACGGNISQLSETALYNSSIKVSVKVNIQYILLANNMYIFYFQNKPKCQALHVAKWCTDWETPLLVFRSWGQLHKLCINYNLALYMILQSTN